MTSHYTLNIIIVVGYTILAFAPPQYLVRWFPDKDTRWITRLAGISGLAYQFIWLYLARHADAMRSSDVNLLRFVKYTFTGITLGLFIAIFVNYYVRRTNKS